MTVEQAHGFCNLREKEVTGLYPAHHGIVNNHMFDPRTGRIMVLID